MKKNKKIKTSVYSVCIGCQSTRHTVNSSLAYVTEAYVCWSTVLVCKLIYLYMQTWCHY